MHKGSSGTNLEKKWWQQCISSNFKKKSNWKLYHVAQWSKDNDFIYQYKGEFTAIIF